MRRQGGSRFPSVAYRPGPFAGATILSPLSRVSLWIGGEIEAMISALLTSGAVLPVLRLLPHEWVHRSRTARAGAQGED
ncbi:MAG: hypothetical protein ACYDC4_00255 [Candidatus Dormibacteria bacterium]|nr:hypothetical protein [Candidatus Saccharimonadales bacterium]